MALAFALLAGHATTLEEQWRFVRPAWRILVAVAAVQAVGAAIGLGLHPVGLVYVDLWYGAAYASPVGFAVGLVWQVLAAPASLREHRSLILFLGVLSILLPVFGYFGRQVWSAAEGP